VARKTELIGPAQRLIPYGGGDFACLACDHGIIGHSKPERVILVALVNAETQAGLFLGMDPKDAKVFAEGILAVVASFGPPKKDGLE